MMPQHEIALFILNGHSQLSAHAERLATAENVIVSPSMIDIQPIRTACPRAKLWAYFRCDAVPLSGPDNPYQQNLRAVMSQFAYSPRISEPNDSAVLIRPSPNAAEAISKHIHREVSRGWDGAYLDQSWMTKPPRFRTLERPYWHTDRTADEADEQSRIRWTSYMELIIQQLFDIPLILNCGGVPPYAAWDHGDCIVAAEQNRMESLATICKRLQQYEKTLLWWGELGVPGWMIEGQRL